MINGLVAKNIVLKLWEMCGIPSHYQRKTEVWSQTFSGVYFSEEYMVYGSGPLHFLSITSMPTT